MRKNRAVRTIEKTKRYLKYGFVITEYIAHYCPRCGTVLSAGPNHQPHYCGNCGQKITFKGVKWIPEKILGYERKEEAR